MTHQALLRGENCDHKFARSRFPHLLPNHLSWSCTKISYMSPQAKKPLVLISKYQMRGPFSTCCAKRTSRPFSTCCGATFLREHFYLWSCICILRLFDAAFWVLEHFCILGWFWNLRLLRLLLRLVLLLQLRPLLNFWLFAFWGSLGYFCIWGCFCVSCCFCIWGRFCVLRLCRLLVKMTQPQDHDQTVNRDQQTRSVCHLPAY